MGCSFVTTCTWWRLLATVCNRPPLRWPCHHVPPIGTHTSAPFTLLLTRCAWTLSTSPNFGEVDSRNTDRLAPPLLLPDDRCICTATTVPAEMKQVCDPPSDPFHEMPSAIWPCEHPSRTQAQRHATTNHLGVISTVNNYTINHWQPHAWDAVVPGTTACTSPGRLAAQQRSAKAAARF